MDRAALIRIQWLSSWRYLGRHPGQLLLAILGLAVGVAAVVSVDIVVTPVLEGCASL